MIVFVLAALLAAGTQSRTTAFASSAAAVQSQNPNATSLQQTSAAESTDSSPMEDSVVMIFATRLTPSFPQPWTKQAPREATGSGFVIEGRRILTNAHVVLYANQIQVQGNQSSEKISATVEAMAPGIDLAVLKLDDESFFDTHQPLARARTLPQVRDSIMVYGYPVGGTNLSITKGIVSRIDFTSYNYGISGLRVQIDAAINPGNSGGPAIVDNKVVGVAFSILAQSQSIGYIIPCEEIDLFLSDVADGHYDGKPALFDEMQTLENPALRSYLKLDKSIEGLVVSNPFADDPSYPLKKWDVITQIGDTPIDDQGNVLLENNQKIHFAYLIQKIAQKGTVPLTIMREGNKIPVQLPVLTTRPKLIPPLLDTFPPYFIWGPIVFSTASEDLVSVLMSSQSGLSMINGFSLKSNPLLTRRNEKPAFEGEELVVIPSRFFVHPLAKGYGTPVLQVVRSLNGIRVRNLRHLVEILRDSRDEFIAIDFFGAGTETLVFRREEMTNATEEILNENGIRNYASPDLLAVWKKQ